MIGIIRTNPSLWTLITPPTVWALHFLTCYVVAAVYCAKAADPLAPLAPVQLVIAAVTVFALAAIAACAWQAMRHWGSDVAGPPHDDDTPRERDRFLGFATLLLCGVSLVGVAFVALPALLIGDCR